MSWFSPTNDLLPYVKASPTRHIRLTGRTDTTLHTLLRMISIVFINLDPIPLEYRLFRPFPNTLRIHFLSIEYVDFALSSIRPASCEIR